VLRVRPVADRAMGGPRHRGGRAEFHRGTDMTDWIIELPKMAARYHAAQAQVEALRTEFYGAIKEARKTGMTQEDIGKLAGMSKGRIQQVEPAGRPVEDEPRCRSCLHLWRWHHRRDDTPGDCSRCACTIWMQPAGGIDPRDEAREARREARLQL
jgi:DNA-binding XRE family transcriptional regulator